MIRMDGKFEMPKNFRQIGGVEDKVKVYIEDFTYTYIKDCHAKENQDKHLILIGKDYKENGKKIISITGAFKVDLRIKESKSLIMNDKARIEIENDMRKYFPESKIMGWVNITNTELEKVYEENKDFHKLNFYEKNSIMFLLNSEEKNEEMYIKNHGEIEKIKGFYVHDAKNDNMCEYLMLNPLEKEEIKKISVSEELDRITESEESTNKVSKKFNFGMQTTFASFSAALLLMCIIMGFGIIKSLDRINKMEQKLSFLGDEYINLHSQMNTIEENDITPVASISNSEKTKKSGKYIYHKVKKGENLNVISEMYYKSRIGVKSILKANEISDINKIYEGQDLIIPLS